MLVALTMPTVGRKLLESGKRRCIKTWGDHSELPGQATWRICLVFAFFPGPTHTQEKGPGIHCLHEITVHLKSWTTMYIHTTMMSKMYTVAIIVRAVF